MKTNKDLYSFIRINYFCLTPFMVGGCHEICSILSLLLRAPGGERIFCPSLFLSVMILKNPYKTKTNKAMMLFFSVEGTYHKGSMP